MDIQIDTTTPYAAIKRQVTSKYDAVFQQLKPGQSLVVAPDDAQKVSQALRKWLEARGKKDQFDVKLVAKMPDGKGRVWLLAKPIRMADLPRRQVSKLVG